MRHCHVLQNLCKLITCKIFDHHSELMQGLQIAYSEPRCHDRTRVAMSRTRPISHVHGAYELSIAARVVDPGPVVNGCMNDLQMRVARLT